MRIIDCRCGKLHLVQDTEEPTVSRYDHPYPYRQYCPACNVPPDVLCWNEKEESFMRDRVHASRAGLP